MHVQYSCGFSVAPSWINFDSSPTLRFERIPLVGRLSEFIAGNQKPFPSSVRYGDIVKGLPVPDNSLSALYAFHVIEHLAYEDEDFEIALRNSLKIMEPGGVFRLIVPDIHARAQRYVLEVSQKLSAASENFIRACNIGLEKRPESMFGLIRQSLGNSSHYWVWDQLSMTQHLVAAGFVEIRRCSKVDSGDPLFDEVEDQHRFTDPRLGFLELAMSARKPLADANLSR
jgi:predicted SAM-dependent methyltransferase